MRLIRALAGLLIVTICGACEREKDAALEPPPPATATTAAPTLGSSSAATVGASSAAGADHYAKASALERKESFAEAEAAFGAGCRARHWPSCIRQAGYHILGLGPRPVDAARAGEILDAPCKAGEQLACSLRILIGIVHQETGLAAVTQNDISSAQWRSAEQACERKLGQPCFLLAVRALAKDDGTAAGRLMGRACESGALEACAIGIPPDPTMSREEALEALVRLTGIGCRGGNQEACTANATERYVETIRSGKPDAAMEKELAKICAAEPSRHWAGSIERMRNPLLAGTCGGLAEFLRDRPGAREQVATLRTRACRLGIPAFCADR